MESGVSIQDELIVAFYAFSLPGAKFSKMLSPCILYRGIICECVCLILIFAEVLELDKGSCIKSGKCDKVSAPNEFVDVYNPAELTSCLVKL